MTLEEMASTIPQAMERCEGIGKRFIKHFIEICETDKNDEEKHHHAMEMQAWFNTASSIVLKKTKKKITFEDLMYWFFTAGETNEDFFDDSDEIDLYCDFIAYLWISKNVLDALEKVGLYNND
jgi:hypothetical protein